MPKSKKPNHVADLIQISKLFMHDAVRLTPQTFKDLYVKNWNLISKDKTFPLLELTREFILETAWRDFMALMVLISGKLNEAASKTNTFQHQIIYPFCNELCFSFNKYHLSFIPNIDIAKGRLEAINFPVLGFDVYLELKMNIFLLSDTPLLEAIAQTESLPALKLIAAGADINKYSPHIGNNPILLAVAKGWNHVSDELPEDKLPGIENQKAIIEALLSREELDVNAINVTTGMTALHIACLRGDEATLIELLLQKGAKMDYKDCYGKTPADYLDYKYNDVKNILPMLLNGFQFGVADHLPNTSTMATLPTEEERARNVLLIKKIFNRVLRAASEDPSAKRPNF